jgi:glycosyltransferase involved in cell wall biosynthesis
VHRRRLRVAFDARMLGEERVGIGNYMVNLVNALGRAGDLGIDVDVFIQEGAASESMEETSFVRLRRLPAMSNWRRLAHQLLDSRALFGNSYDVVHFPDYPIGLRRVHARIIVTIPDASIFHSSKYHTVRKSLPKRLLYPVAAARAETVITYSEASRRDLERHVPELRQSMKVRVITLGPSGGFLDPSSFDDSVLERVVAKYTLHGPYILFVGTLEPRKNLRGLLEAFGSVSSLVPHELIVVGPRGWGGEGRLIRESSARLGARIRFLDYVPDEDLPAIYRLATLLAYPSFCEGFGLPIVEAFAADTAVLTSSRSSMKEIAGEAALLVDPDNIDEMATGLLRLCVDEALRRELVERGQERVRRYSWDRCALETASLYSAKPCWRGEHSCPPEAVPLNVGEVGQTR